MRRNARCDAHIVRIRMMTIGYAHDDADDDADGEDRNDDAPNEKQK